MDRKDTIITDDADKAAEDTIIRSALNQCGYPTWAIQKVEIERSQPKGKKHDQKTNDTEQNKGLVVVPYVEGLTEKVSRVFKKHGFSTAIKPHRTLRSMIVHPKDKRDPLQTAEAIYEIDCKNCPKSYIGETGRLFRTRLQEHKSEAEKVSERKYTRSTRKTSTTETF